MLDAEAAGLRLAIYARVSTEEQREGQTINSQIAELERFARDKAWDITGVYKDEGWSGGIMERPELDRLRDDARRGLFQAVLINDVDRLARDVAHLGVIKRDLEKRGMRVIFRKLPSDASPTNNLMVNILGSFAEFERELIIDRTRRGRRHAVEVRKQYLSSHHAYGYKYTPKDHTATRQGRLEVESDEARVVRQMFDWVDAEGLSARRVMNRLNERSVPTRKGAPWAKSSVLRILHSEMYAGTWHYNKVQACEPVHRATDIQYRRRTKSSVRQRPRDEWLPLELPPELTLITRGQWERVQARLHSNITFSPRNEKHFYLLKGLVRCGGCRATYGGDPCHGKFYYRCVSRCKRQPSVTEHILDQTVVDAVEDVLANPSLLMAEMERFHRSERDVAYSRRHDGAKAEKELRRIESEENRLLAAYRTGIISPAQLGVELEKLKSRRTIAESQLAKELSKEPEVPPALIRKSVEDYCKEARRNLRALPPEDLRELLRTLIHSIIFEGSQIRIRGRLPICDSGEPTQVKATFDFVRSAETRMNSEH